MDWLKRLVSKRTEVKPDLQEMHASGPSIGTFNGEPIPEWIHLTDGRVLVYEGTIREGVPFTLDPDVMIVDDALLYREAPDRKTMPVPQMQALIERGKSLERHRETILEIVRGRFSGEERVQVDPAADMVPGMEGGAWVAASIRSSEVDQGRAEAAIEAVKVEFDREGKIEVQDHEPPISGGDGRLWVPTLIFVSDRDLRGLH